MTRMQINELNKIIWSSVIRWLGCVGEIDYLDMYSSCCHMISQLRFHKDIVLQRVSLHSE